MKYTVILLAWYSLAVTGWYQYNMTENERIVLEYEKLLLLNKEEESIVVSCSTELEERTERPYTFDQWVTEKPCPEGKHGPLCHMNTGPEEQ